MVAAELEAASEGLPEVQTSGLGGKVDMANWQRKLDLKDLWEQHEEGVITIQTVAAGIADRLAALERLGVERLNEEREELVEAWRSLSEDPSADISDFDDVLARLYDWADSPIGSTRDFFRTRKACWVATF